MPIIVRKSSGEILTAGGGSYYGSTREDDVPARSSVPVLVQFLDDYGVPTLLNPAAGVLTFTAQPADGDTFTIGGITYTAKATLPSATADEVLLGASLAAFIANLVGAINGATSNNQAAGATYSSGTTTNPLASAAASGSTVIITAARADASGNTVVTGATSAHASFAASTLTMGDVLNLDIKPVGEYDAKFTLPTPVFTAPLDPATGYYMGTLATVATGAITLLDPNNPTGATPNAQEPDSVPLMSQLSWGPVTTPATPPNRSGKWTINLDNSIRHGDEDTTDGGSLGSANTGDIIDGGSL